MTLVFLIAILPWACDHSSNPYVVDVISYLGSGEDINLVHMPAGTFLMGSDLFPIARVDTVPVGVNMYEIDTTYNFERPVHPVSLSSFVISATEITQEQYQAVMGTNPSHFSGTENLPVENVTWFEAAAFCNRLSELAGLALCYDKDTWQCDFEKNGFRLPTEAEWEYACRAGISLEYYSGGTERDLDRAGWYLNNSLNTTHEVGRKVPNAAGLYDMHGNVAEWTYDVYGFYQCGTQVDPSVPGSQLYRSIRGGSWASRASSCRSAYRTLYDSRHASSTIGFRIVRR